MKAFPLKKEDLLEIEKQFPTPFYIYDECAIERNMANFRAAFDPPVFRAFKEHFAVKACPNPAIMRLLANCGAGFDCSSMAELVLCERIGVKGKEIIFTSNETPDAEFRKAYELGAVINLDDITHIDVLKKVLGKLPDTICFRYNPGDLKAGGNLFIGKPLEAKYGLTRPQILEAYGIAKSSGVKIFGLHTMVASNELDIDCLADTAKILFDLCVELKDKVGVRLDFIDLGGGVGIPYKPGEVAVDYKVLSKKIKDLYDKIITPAGLDIEIKFECGRPITGPYGFLVAKAIREKHIYRDYIGLNASMADLMRPAMYGAYHEVIVLGKESAAQTKTYDIVGSLCENCDKFAVQRALPEIEIGDFIVICDAGAHGRAMGFNYNGKLRCGELLLKKDGTIKEIRRAETLDDYFSTLIF